MRRMIKVVSQESALYIPAWTLAPESISKLAISTKPCAMRSRERGVGAEERCEDMFGAIPGASSL
jgi:hypothetical protein